jgi:hypothetical protein
VAVPGGWRAPLGFDSGDTNLYRYVFNRPTVLLDPTGRGAVTVVDKPSDDIVYIDEFIKRGAGRLKDADFLKALKELGEFGDEIRAGLQQYQKMIDNLIALKKKKGLDIEVHYISSGPNGFAKAAANNGPNSINLYIGHGYYREVVIPFLETNPLFVLASYFQPGQQLPSQRVIDDVKKALGEKIVVETGAAPRFGFFSCYAGHYNEVVNSANQVPSPFPERGTVITTDYATHFNKAFGELEKLIDNTIQDTKKNVTLHLYFGDDSKRTDEIKKAEKNGRDYLFEKW